MGGFPYCGDMLPSPPCGGGVLRMSFTLVDVGVLLPDECGESVLSGLGSLNTFNGGILSGASFLADIFLINLLLATAFPSVLSTSLSVGGSGITAEGDSTLASALASKT